MCKKNSTNEDNFVYLARENLDDPYDLKIFDYKYLNSNNKKINEFYTLRFNTYILVKRALHFF